MSSLKLKLLVLSLTLGFNVAAIAQPTISVNTNVLNYGNVAVNSDSVRAIIISNTGNAGLTISSMEIVGTNPTHFSLPNPPTLPVVVGPGASLSPIDVLFAPTSFGQKFAVLRIISDDPDPERDTLDVVLTGTGLAPDINAAPNPLEFGNVTTNSELILTVSVSNIGNSNLVISSFQITGSNANQFSLMAPPTPPVTIAPGGAVPLQMRFRPTSAGLKTAFLRIASNDPDENPFDVVLNGTGVSPTISVTPASLNFGRVLVNSDSTATVSIFNTGQGNLFIQSLDIANDLDTLFSLVSPPQLPDTLPPGGGPLTISVKFSPKAQGNVTAFLIITHNDLTQNPLSIPLSGRGVFAQIAVSANTLSFGNVLVTSFSELSLQVSNTGEGPLFITAAPIVGTNGNQFSLFNLPPLPIKINPGAPPVTIRVRFLPTSIGTKEAFLALINNDPDPPQNPFFVSLDGFGVKPDILASPAELDFGEVVVDSSAELSTIIKNVGNVDLIVSDIAIVGNDANQFVFSGIPPLPFTVRPGIDSVSIPVQFIPTTGGTKNAILRLVNNTPDENPYDIPLEGIGTVPDIAARPVPLDLGNVLLGQETTGIVRIFNEGRAPLTISDTAFAGQYAYLFSIVSMPPLPAVLPPDTAIKLPITIRFRPDSLQLKTAELHISSNDPDEDPYIITLRGTGVQPAIAANPGALDFDSVRVRTDSVMVLEIRNSGSATLVVQDTFMAGEDAGHFSIVNIPQLPFSVTPNGEPVPISVRFSPKDLGPKLAAFRIFSNAPQSPLDVPLSGIGVEPDIAASPDTLNFGKVVLNTGEDRSLILLNEGGAVLTVNGVTIAGEKPELFSFVNLPGLPFTILPDQTVSVTVRFTPDSLGEKSAELRFLSDDPDEPTLAVPAIGIGAIPIITLGADTLSFGNTGVNLLKILPLRITNPGSAPLEISDTLFSGENGEDFTLVDFPPLPLIIPEEGGEQEILVGFRPGSAGFKNALLQILSNDPANPLVGVALDGRGVNRPQINAFNLSEVRLNQNVGVEANVSADTVIQSVTLRYGFGNSVGFPRQLTLVEQSAGLYSGTIPAADITVNGLKMVLEVLDGFSITTDSTRYAAVLIPAGALPDTFSQNQVNRWMMYSLPFEPTSVANSSIDAVLADLGGEGDFSWRIYRTDSSGVNSNYHNRGQLNNMGDYGRFLPGNAFWLYLRDDNQGSIPTRIIDFPEMRTTPVDSYTVTLQEGWNQLGSPYAFDVTWNQVVSDFKDSLQVYRYEGGTDFTLLTTGGGFEKVGWTPLVNANFTISPWTGYAVYNKAGRSVRLIFYPQLPASGAPLLAKSPGEESGWQLQMVAESALNYAISVVGMHGQAKPGRDYLDYSNPPVMGDEYVSMYFRHPEWNPTRADFCSDFRPLNSQGEVWYFNINSSGRIVDFRLRNLENLPANFRVVLFDAKYRNRYHLSEGQRVSLRDLSPGEDNRFVLLVGTDSFIEAESGNVVLMQPSDHALLENYPNPFNPETYIRYRLASSAKVSLKIYNLLGQEVASLVDEFQPAGFYEVRWDGRARSGGEAASGVYFFTINAGEFTRTQKMILLR
ncbi:MAG: choice-of-anchor D domain-containing protein [Calditrichaceae bacterium]|nr:choice-of-anchor D domain-containing protein [Calditrichia bacterium]NUQ40880.1 choice-of-anchor D domain-containing protein [Calditrichaceae bacterium]